MDRGLGHRREVECRRALAQIADVVTGAVVRRRLREVDASGEYEVIGLRGEFSGNEGRETAWTRTLCGRLFAPSSRMDDYRKSARRACGVDQDAAKRARRARPSS